MLIADTHIDATLVENSLQHILGSHYFKSSAQCSSLLRYVVENTLADREDCLRERVIGAEVFDRAPDYDTGNDHIVRSRASEVRKRLAQYYQDPNATAEVRIGIPSGSYRATFDSVRSSPNGASMQDSDRVLESIPAALDASASTSSEPTAPQNARQGAHKTASESTFFTIHAQRNAFRSKKLVATCAILMIVVGSGVLGKAWLGAQGSAFDRFWAPLNKSPKPVLIYCGGGFVYKLSDQFLDEYSLKHGQKYSRREFFVDLKPGESVQGQDLIPDKHFVPFGDLASTARVVTTLAGFKKPYDLRYGDDLAFTEFRSSPVILIGGLNNSWALKVMHNLRFVLEHDDRIVDQWHRDKVWTQKADPDNQARDDYAIISRLNASGNGNGGFVLSIAGIRMYGTRAAAELISDPSRLNDVLKSLPRGWETKDLQVVLHTKTMNEIPISTDIEAIYSW